MGGRTQARSAAVRTSRAALVALAALLSAACGGSGERPDILLITIDTWRADHLAAAGHPFLRTPVLDELAVAGVRFSAAMTTAPNTLPAHASLLTGTYPAWHGARTNGYYRLVEEAVTLPEVLAGQGYATAAFVGSAVLDATFGLAQGFSTYDDRMTSQAGVQAQRPAPEVNAAAIAWLDSLDEAPFFLWAHYFDPHGPYEPPAPFDGMYYEGDPRTPDKDEMAGARLPYYQNLAGITDAGYPRAQYAAEVSFTDHSIGKLLAHLERLGRRDNLLIIVTSDHGESLGEHGYYFDHGLNLAQPSMAIPLLMAWPGRIEAEKVVDTPVSLVDVEPTVLALLGLGTPAEIHGASLAPLVLADAATSAGPAADSSRPLYFETWVPREWELGPPQFGIRQGRWKLVSDGTEAVFADLVADPREVEPAVADASVAQEMAGRLSRLQQELTREVAGARQTATEEMERKLRSLGYVR